jgi:hypothetical protein
MYRCGSPTLPCCYGVVPSLRGPRFAALVVEIVGSTSSWISGNITRDWITRGTEHLLDGTWLLVHNLRYIYVSVHYTLWFIQRRTVTRETPGTETSTTTPDNSQDGSEASRFLRQWQSFLPSLLKSYATLGDVPQLDGTHSKRQRLGSKIKSYMQRLTLQVSNA